ncbi:MAG: peptidoglycan editing factor PgeF [Oscillospiraceae bacterium]|nr:peptidoglycan editing factor PgeF [Oscillospiraceae bacterium]MCD8256487.1 peptidoglycan editing factor PgeF [Oscillospiraceae bacterium]
MNGTAFLERETDGVVYQTASVIAARHAFTTRYGGVSKGVYSSLNLGEHRGDAPEAVAENYRRLSAATGIDTARMAFTRQVHGNEVHIAAAEDVHTLGTEIPYTADGLVTAEPGLALICFAADCIPVLLCDAVHGVIGAVHCGWRSSVADILCAAWEQMCSLGARTENICAALGPAIGFCHFEVGGEVVDAVEDYLYGDIDGLVRPADAPEKYYLDLRAANARRLRQLGVLAENIAVSAECTVCSNEKYWSHRYTHGVRGNQAALIVL